MIGMSLSFANLFSVRMRSWRLSGRTASGWSAWLSMLLLSVAACGCAVEEAHCAEHTAVRVDGGSKRSVSEKKHVRPDGAADSPNTVSKSKDRLVGLTRAQVKARRGPPTQERGHEWVYTPDQPGCRDIIVSEIVTFKGDVVVSVQLEMTDTHKVCGGERREFE
jgi:hypothetical protein